MKGSVKGRVRNITLAKSRALDTVMEAVVNSIQAIGPDNISTGVVNVKMIYDTKQKTVDSTPRNVITGFEITDNGVGFTDINYQSFDELDSINKLELGGKGIGRLLWLKVFDHALIDSVYSDESGSLRRRKFKFVLSDEFEDYTDEPVNNAKIETKITLVSCNKEYLDNIQISGDSLSTSIMSHCISYFVSDKAPIIVIEDRNGCATVNERYREIRDTKHEDNFELRGEKFTIIHFRLYDLTPYKNEIIYCADGFSVITDDIPNVLKTQSIIDDDGKKFKYNAFIFSTFLDKHTVNERTGFNIPNTTLENPDALSLNQIKNKVISFVNKYIEQCTKGAVKIRDQRIAEFIKNNGQFSVVMQLDEDFKKEINPNSTDDDLFEQFNDKLAKIESRIRVEVCNAKNNKNPLGVSDAVENALKNVEAVQKANLTKYILHRKEIIELYEKSIKLKQTKNGAEYTTENHLHNLLLPMRIDNDKITMSNCNLWLLDDRFNYYAYRNNAFSDKQIKSFTDNNKCSKRPDIVVYSELSNDGANAASIAIIELKRPDRKDKAVADQVREYINKLKGNSIIDYDGNKILVTKNTRFYCYILCDLNTDNEIQELLDDDWQELFDNLGYCRWFSKLNAYIEFVDYNRLIDDAKRRNKVFFELIDN